MYVQATDTIEAQEIPEYEGLHDDVTANFNLDFDEEDLPSPPHHNTDLRPRQKRSCSPARKAATPPKTVPR